MSDRKDLLVEIGTEELPPKALSSLMYAFAARLDALLDEARLEHDDVHAYASPRRLAVRVDGLAAGQADAQLTQKGPPVSIGIDKDGQFTAAGTAFAKKCGVAVEQLERRKTDKGEWLYCELVETGESSESLLPGIIERALADLPIPRRMRWGAGDAEFVRPVHWVVLLHGNKTIDGNVMGLQTGNKTLGHRFHCKKPIRLKSADDYLSALEQRGHVIADFARRRDLVVNGVNAAAKSVGGHIVDGESLYDEVTSLVEWPVPLTGRFDAEYLVLPREVVVSTLTGHQRYFPIANDAGELMPYFVTVANLDSQDPQQVRDGNERVIRPRLADAAFFWDSDKQAALADRQASLREVVYQRGLGSLAEKSQRVASLARWLANRIGVDAEQVERAASLAKCDLLTGMVGEFPDLQGIMGRYYAIADGEPQAVSTAIGEQYLPRFAGDALPQTVDGQLLGIADKLDTLAGIFAIGKKPSGNRDPFGLRRAALGIVRILVETGLDIDLKAMLDEAARLQPKAKLSADELAEALHGFIAERLRRYFLDRDSGLASETFDAVLARGIGSLVDFDRRLQAVQSFIRLENASSLAAANKRIANILKQTDEARSTSVREKLLADDAELALWSALVKARAAVAPMLERRDYTNALSELASLREPVDRFFDDVMVMADDEATRNNRLALLNELRALFLGVADISRLAIG